MRPLRYALRNARASRLSSGIVQSGKTRPHCCIDRNLQLLGAKQRSFSLPFQKAMTLARGGRFVSWLDR